MVMPPVTKNRTRQGARACSFLAIPYIKRAATIWATPFMATHVDTRELCSLRLYHREVMMMKAGETLPSVKPRKKRIAAIPPKLLGEARHISTAPQAMMVPPTNTVMGSRLSRYAAGHWEQSWPR
jgi:hypothetical protein